MTRSEILMALTLLLSVESASAGHFTTPEEAPAVSTNDLMIRAQNYDPEAIKELGRRNEHAAIGILKKIAADPDIPRKRQPLASGHISPESQREELTIEFRNRSHIEARTALARLGERQELDEFIVGLSSTNDQWRADCISRLGEIGDKRAVRYLIPILDANEGPRRPGNTALPPPNPNKRHRRSSLRPSTSYGELALHSLRRILPDVEKQLAAQSGTNGATFAQWKQWWRDNKDTFDKAQ